MELVLPEGDSPEQPEMVKIVPVAARKMRIVSRMDLAMVRKSMPRRQYRVEVKFVNSLEVQGIGEGMRSKITERPGDERGSRSDRRCFRCPRHWEGSIRPSS